MTESKYDRYLTPCLQAEIDKLKQIRGKFAFNDFKALDSLHYNGFSYLEEIMEAESIDSGSKVLELFSGYGAVSRFVADRFKAAVSCIEPSQRINEIHSEINKLCEVGSTEIIQTNPAIFDADSLRTEGQFQVVYSLQSFVYLTQKNELFKTCNSALKLSGRLYIEDFVIENSINLTAKEQELANQSQFLSRLTRNEYVRALEDAGFHIDEYTYRTTEWSRYVFSRAENILRDKERIVKEYGEEMWNVNFSRLIEIDCRLFHQLSVTLDEAQQSYPLTFQHFGEEDFERLVCETPAKFGRVHIKATKIKSLV